MTRTDEDPAAKPAPVVTEQPAEKSRVHVKLSFVPKPISFKVNSLGNDVWSGDTPEGEVERDLELEYPKEGIDLLFTVKWAEQTPSAVRVQLTAPDGTVHDKSLWGNGSVSDVITFQ